jgi:hypothetical protein
MQPRDLTHRYGHDTRRQHKDQRTGALDQLSNDNIAAMRFYALESRRVVEMKRRGPLESKHKPP